MRPLRVSLVLFVVLAWSSKAPAHEDHIIRIKDGKLVGLPEKYAPAEISLDESRLRIGDNEMVFSPLLKSLFDLPHELKLTASWDHDPKILPPYLLIAIHPKGKDYGYELLLNMDTLDLIKLSVTLRESENSERVLPIALSDKRKEDICKSVRKVK